MHTLTLTEHCQRTVISRIKCVGYTSKNYDSLLQLVQCIITYHKHYRLKCCSFTESSLVTFQVCWSTQQRLCFFVLYLKRHLIKSMNITHYECIIYLSFFLQCLRGNCTNYYSFFLMPLYAVKKICMCVCFLQMGCLVSVVPLSRTRSGTRCQFLF